MAQRKTTYYELLGVSRNAKLTDITRAYNRHKAEVTRDTAPPDLKRETKLREAYETLADEERRAAYDASLVEPDRRYRSRVRAIWIGAIGVVLAAGYLLLAREPERAPVAARTSQQILEDVSLSIGRVHSIEVSGSSLPVGMAFAIGEGVLVTTCDRLAPSSQLVLNIPPRSIPARVATVDPELGLCRLSAEGVGSRPLAMSRIELKAGDLVYAPKVNASGNLHLAQSTVKQVLAEPRGRVVEAGASGLNGAPLLDVEGHVIGVATDGRGRHLAVPSVWFAQAREPRKEAKPAAPEPAPAAAPERGPATYPTVPKTIDDIPPERRERLEKAFRPPPKIDEDLMK